MNEIRFVGGVMDGLKGRDTQKPERVRAGGKFYEHSATDDDGTLVYSMLKG